MFAAAGRTGKAMTVAVAVAALVPKWAAMEPA
jgi:hypothetical protein